MRTTLKRGLGHSTAPLDRLPEAGQEDGRSVASARMPGPIRRYRQPQPERRPLGRRVGRVAGWLVLGVAVVGSGLAGGAYLYAHETLGSLAAHSTQVRQAEKALGKVPAPRRPALALIAGYDQRMGAENAGYAGSRSDTIMLVRADPSGRTLSLLSLPRDLVVPIYCSGSTVAAQDRINAAWAICGGPKGTLNTVEHLTGLRFNYLITVDFRGFKLLVNKLHGVYMNVDRRYYNPPGDGWSAIDLEPGYQKLDGGQALSFVRFRHTDSDLYRLARQQLFLEALKSRLRSSLSLTGIPRVIGALKGNVEIGRGGGGAPSLAEIQAYAGLLYHLPATRIIRNAIDPTLLQPYGPSGAELVTAQANVDAVVQRFLHPHPPVSVASRADAHTSGPGTVSGRRRRPLKPNAISTLVLNAGNVAGRAANTTYLLRKLGYRTRQLPATVPANAPGETLDTTVYYDPLRSLARQAAGQLAHLFGAHTRIRPLSPAIAPYARRSGNPLAVVALGTRFDGTLTTPAPSHQPAPRQPAAVSDDPAATLSALQAVAGQAHVPLLVPTEIAAGSQLSSMQGIRAYRPLQDQHTVALTFVTPAGNVYWQIQETTWNTAPILANPTGRATLGGRRYDLYTSGGHIHMIVLRTPRASYWVVNTLLDALTNQTMLAIARGLRPLGS
jgi:LCP family protein required for cell wall assembly